MLNNHFQIFLLKHLKGIGNKGLLKLLNYVILKEECLTNLSHYEIIEVLQVNAANRARLVNSLEEIKNNQEELYEKFLTSQFITILDDNYPALLLNFYNPPIGLFYKGNIDLLKFDTIGIVGARDNTDYGFRITDKIVAELVTEQYTIVSGLAKGIDTLAHQSAINHKGKTIAVMAHGLDQVYPKQNASLFEELINHHLVLSEYLEGTPPQKHQFPMRNRIIAGISQGVCVIEAKARSGSLITAQQALDNNREVFAVPGSIYSQNSVGCHELIQNGAKLTTKASHIIEEISQFRKNNIDKDLTK